MNYLVYGLESFLIDQNIKKIVKDNNINEDSIYKIDMNNNSIETLIDRLNTYDLFSDKKVIIAYDSLFLSTNKEIKEYNTNLLLDYLKNPNNMSILIIRLDNKLDERKTITKEIKKLSTTIKCDNLNDLELLNYIKNSFTSKGYKIDISALNEFILRIDKNLYSVNNEINKLLMYKLEDKTINENDIKIIIHKKIYDDVFLFVDSVINNDKKKAFLIYNDLVNYYNEEIIKLINLVYTQFRLMYQVSVLKKENMNKDEISTQLKVHPYRVQLILKNKNINEELLIKYIYKLCELDLKIKTGLVNKSSAFELFLLSI